MGQSHLIPKLLLMVTLACCLNACSTVLNVGVDDIASGAFTRVHGTGYGGAVTDLQGWYSQDFNTPTVVLEQGQYRIWFVGSSESSDPETPYGLDERIGLAVSQDGINWKIANGGRPVFDFGAPGKFDSKGVTQPYVLRLQDKYMMYYGGIDGTLAADLGLTPGHVRVERIGLATSEDGIRWKRANGGDPVLNIGPPGSIDSIQATGMHVLYIDGTFVMWYGAYDGRHTIGMATSSDGILWKKANNGEAVTGLQGEWGQVGPSVYWDGTRFIMLYSTATAEGKKLFAALSEDGIDWRSAYDGQPVLGTPPPGNFDTAGLGHNHSVHPSQFLISKNKVRVWYSAQDSVAPNHARVGLMELSVP